METANIKEDAGKIVDDPMQKIGSSA